MIRPPAPTEQIRRVTWLSWGVSRVTRALIGYALCVIAATVGLGLELGVGWGLTAGGTVGAVSFLLLSDVDEKPKPR